MSEKDAVNNLAYVLLTPEQVIDPQKTDAEYAKDIAQSATIDFGELPDSIEQWLQLLLSPEILFGQNLLSDGRLATFLRVVEQLSTHHIQALPDGSLRLSRIYRAEMSSSRCEAPDEQC